MNKLNLNLDYDFHNKLAQKVGTPAYIYDENKLVDKLSSYQKHFVSDKFQTDVIYASKAFTCRELLKMLTEYNFCLDVVSKGEMFSAVASGYELKNAYFHGNNKTEDELYYALENGIGTIVIDNISEVVDVIRIAEELKVNVNTLIRLNPGIEAHTHKYIVTAHIESKFGILASDMDSILGIIKQIQNSEYVSFMGFHAHIGSQIFEIEAFKSEISILFDFIEKLNKEHSIAVRQLDLGGGFAVHYTDEDKPIPTETVCREIISCCEENIEKRNLPLDKLMIEPGRSIVAEAGYTLYRVGYLKQTPTKLYAFVDGGMSDNIRVALYDAKYDCEILGKEDAPKDTLVSLAGKCCESGDILINEIMLPRPEQNDLVAVLTTGAYGHSMASNYNRNLKPAVVFVKGESARLVVRREEYNDFEEMQRNDEIEL